MQHITLRITAAQQQSHRAARFLSFHSRAGRLAQLCGQGCNRKKHTVPAEAMQPMAQVVGAADQHQAPGQAQVPQAALQLLPLALLHTLRAVLQALLCVPHF